MSIYYPLLATFTILVCMMPAKRANPNEDQDKKQAKGRGVVYFPPLGTLTDRFDNTFQFGNAGDFWVPSLPMNTEIDYRTHFRQVQNMEFRTDDLIICSYPKTGLHWTEAIIKMLRSKSSEYHYDDPDNFGFMDKQSVGYLSKMRSPRLLRTHIPFRHLPKQMFEKKVKIIYLIRNPKDVLVSFYNHMHNHVAPLGYPGTFEHFFHLCMEIGYLYGDIFDYYMEWQKGLEANPQLDVFTSVYEDMKLDPVDGVKKLNEFLGTGCSDDLCEAIARACSFTKLKAHSEETAPAIVKQMFKDKQLWFYRKGDVGDWKNWFTVAMNEYFDKEYEKRMKDFKTVFKWTLP